MEIQDKMTLEATGEFPFKFFIEKAVATEEADEFILEGIASTTNLDHDSERMSKSALRSMEAVINEEGVPLRVEHQKEDDAIIGKVFEARVDDRNQLHVKCRLDKSHPASLILYNSMKSGAKMGLSVGGLVKRAVRELSEKTGKMVKTFYDVALKEVSVTPRPANYDSWLVAKSIVDSEDEGDRFRDSAVYQEFLFENPKLDYLQSFAKSIPDSAWRKIASQDNTTDMATNKTSEEEARDTEKAVSRSEFTALAGLVTKGFESMTALVSKALNVEAHDQNAPVQDKEEPIGDQTKVATQKAEGDAMDQVNPDESKDKEVGDGTAKSEERPSTQDEANGSDVNGTREKTSDKEETEKTTEEDETKKDTTDEYKLETVERATKSMESLLARINKTETEEDKSKSETEEEKTKTTDEEEKDKSEETDTTKGMHPIDAFVSVVSKAMEAMVDKMEKTGKSVPGFEKHLINQIREDTELQAEIVKMAKIPGFKKSVSMGVPYVATKDGRRFALTMTEAGAPTIEKSKKEGAERSFKDLYKSEFSSIRGAE